jgi:serine/threonine-protein kinase RsbW
MTGLSDPVVSTQVTIPGDPLAVREGLKALFETVVLRNLPEDGRGTAEIVLAEALNNIVEHAYAHHAGDIEISLHLRPNELICRITDTGQPMPDDQLPEGKLAGFTPDGELPEGGFGWFLIRSLSQDLHYRREGGRNLLSFRLETGQSSH